MFMVAALVAFGFALLVTASCVGLTISVQIATKRMNRAGIRLPKKPWGESRT